LDKKVKYQWVDKYCLALTGVIKDFKSEWNATRYLVGGKMFAMCCGDKDGKPIITVKLDPGFGTLLRQKYKYIVPGYYMNKDHCNSLYLEGDVPDDVLKTMIQESYQLILNSLSKKIQKEIMEERK